MQTGTSDSNSAYYTIQTHVCIYSFEDIFAFLLVKSAIASFIFVKLFLRQSLQNTTYIILCIAEESFSSAYIPHPIFHFSFIRIHANTLIINPLELLINLITIQLYSQPLYNILKPLQILCILCSTNYKTLLLYNP